MKFTLSDIASKIYANIYFYFSLKITPIYSFVNREDISFFLQPISNIFVFHQLTTSPQKPPKLTAERLYYGPFRSFVCGLVAVVAFSYSLYYRYLFSYVLYGLPLFEMSGVAERLLGYPFSCVSNPSDAIFLYFDSKRDYNLIEKENVLLTTQYFLCNTSF